MRSWFMQLNLAQLSSWNALDPISSPLRHHSYRFQDYKKYANLALAVQTVLNCRAGGSCEGGNPAAVYEFAKDIGVREREDNP